MHAMTPGVISLVSAIEDAELPWPYCGTWHPLLGTDLLKNKLLSKMTLFYSIFVCAFPL